MRPDIWCPTIGTSSRSTRATAGEAWSSAELHERDVGGGGAGAVAKRELGAELIAAGAGEQRSTVGCEREDQVSELVAAEELGSRRGDRGASYRQRRGHAAGGHGDAAGEDPAGTASKHEVGDSDDVHDRRLRDDPRWSSTGGRERDQAQAGGGRGTTTGVVGAHLHGQPESPRA